MRRILEERTAGYRPPESNNERRLEEILDRAGEPRLRRQVDVGGEMWTCRVDYRDLELPLVVRVQSERFHSAPLDERADQLQADELASMGLAVVDVWDSDLWYRPAAVIEQIRAVRARLRQLLVA